MFLKFVFKLFFLCILFYIVTLSNNSAYAFFNAKFEPVDGKIYHGAQAEVRPINPIDRNIDWDGIERYVKACGYRPKLIMHYISLDPVAFWLLESTIYDISQQPYDYVPQIGLDFYSYIGQFNILKPDDITKKISLGEYDERIKNLGDIFIKMKGPVFLRPGYEFGGNGQGRHASKKYWIQAWKRIYTIFKNIKADNVAFVWNTLDEKNFLEYYPGNAYVDWWGINIFCNNADKNPFINNFIREAARHKKPVMIAESTPRYIGSVSGEKSWKLWYIPYYNLITKYKHIKAFCYINASWNQYPDKTFKYDCRIQKDPFVLSHYRHLLTDSGFINAKPK